VIADTICCVGSIRNAIIVNSPR